MEGLWERVVSSCLQSYNYITINCNTCVNTAYTILNIHVTMIIIIVKNIFKNMCLFRNPL